MQNDLYININLEVCLPNFYNNDEEMLDFLNVIKNNPFEFIRNYEEEFKVTTLFELKESQD